MANRERVLSFVSIGLFQYKRGEVSQVLFVATDGVQEITEKERAVVRHLLNAEPPMLAVGETGTLHPVDDFLMVVKAAMLEMFMLRKVTERYYYYVRSAFTMLSDALQHLAVDYSYRYDPHTYIAETADDVLGQDVLFDFASSEAMAKAFVAFLNRAVEWCAKFEDEPDNRHGHGIKFLYPARPTRIQQATMGYFVRPKSNRADGNGAPRPGREDHHQQPQQPATNLRFCNQAGEVTVTVPVRSSFWDDRPGTSASCRVKPVAVIAPIVVEHRHGGEDDGDEGEDASEITDDSSTWSADDRDRIDDAEEEGEEDGGEGGEALDDETVERAEEDEEEEEGDPYPEHFGHIESDYEDFYWHDYDQRERVRDEEAHERAYGNADLMDAEDNESSDDDVPGGHGGEQGPAGRRTSASVGVQVTPVSDVIVIDSSSSSEDEEEQEAVVEGDEGYYDDAGEARRTRSAADAAAEHRCASRREDPRTLLIRTRRVASRMRERLASNRTRSRSPRRDT